MLGILVYAACGAMSKAGNNFDVGHDAVMLLRENIEGKQSGEIKVADEQQQMSAYWHPRNPPTAGENVLLVFVISMI
jgi:hypothetical protein